MKIKLIIILYAVILIQVNCKSNNFNIFQRILKSLSNKNKDDNNNNQQLQSIHNQQSDQTSLTPAIQEVTLLIVNKLISYAIFYASFKLITNTISSSWKKAMDQVNEMKDSLSSTNSNVPSNYTKYLKANTTLNSYELEIFQTLITPLSIDTNLNDIGNRYLVLLLLLYLYYYQMIYFVYIIIYVLMYTYNIYYIYTIVYTIYIRWIGID